MAVKQVTFKSFGVDLVGNLYLPDDFDENKNTRASLVLAHSHRSKNKFWQPMALKWLQEDLSF